MVDSGWTRGDTLTAWGVAATILVGAGGIWAALFSLQFQEWWKRRSEYAGPIILGSLSGDPLRTALPPGVLKADRKTLEILLTAFAEVDLDWLRTYEFGGSFQWSAVKKVRDYVWANDRPEQEFLDKELESLWVSLTAAILKFVHLAGLYTQSIFHDAEEDVRKIPDQFENGQYSDRRFHQKRGEINVAAEVVCSAYDAVVRRARLKLASAEDSEDEV